MGELNYLRIAKTLGGTLTKLPYKPTFGAMTGAAQLSAERFRLLPLKKKRRIWTVEETGSIVEAFKKVRDGFEVDRVLVDAALSRQLVTEVHARGVKARPAEIFRRLQDVRKSTAYGFIIPKVKRAHGLDTEPFKYAAELGYVQFGFRHDASVDDIIVDPKLGDEFVGLCEGIAPHGTAAVFKWALLQLRKQQGSLKSRAANRLAAMDIKRVEKRLHDVGTLDKLSASSLPDKTGFFSISQVNGSVDHLYVGHGKLRKAVAPFEGAEPFRKLAGDFWKPKLNQIVLRVGEVARHFGDPTALQFSYRLIDEWHPLFNIPFELEAESN